jgi:hypothetical protein
MRQTVPSELKTREKLREFEIWVTVCQVTHVISAMFFDILEIRMTLSRLNPPRLLISQSMQYLAMVVAAVFSAFAKSYTRRKPAVTRQALPAISAATLTILDISCDACSKIALLLGPRDQIEGFLGFLPLIQTVVSHFTFSSPIIATHFFGALLHTAGFVIVSASVLGKPSEPIEQERWRVLGLASRTAGYLFGGASLVLRCLNLTMTQALSASIHLSAASFCRGTGTWGLLLTAAYHAAIWAAGRERMVVLKFADRLPILTALFVAVAALKHYTAFWLVLHTSALEFSLVVAFVDVVLCVARRVMFREDGATFGYAQFPVVGSLAILIGFAMLSVRGHHPEENSVALAEPLESSELSEQTRSF